MRVHKGEAKENVHVPWLTRKAWEAFRNLGIDWLTKAACRNKDPAIFYHKRKENEALDICGVCEVRQTCLTYSLMAEEPWGVWGGITENQRRDMIVRKKWVDHA